MISTIVAALGSFVVGDLVTLALARFMPMATAKIAGPTAIKVLAFLAQNYGKQPERTQAEWDSYALSHCSPDVWNLLKDARTPATDTTTHEAPPVGP
ncbi:hypothetical protein KOR42_32980 [Thalassoglobus neptunius]|uniref:Uncharacterized protein n=1 Tax=Thalassoglobus neptunius TaxID=1938619 RepID=A0A5C5WNN5_9PLAN|nr:hypothetical protein [Thalassoglobus neptunius]TWT51825.1 hypothetical protein KOR42_32980 [Thalassoglobus neptunius]